MRTTLTLDHDIAAQIELEVRQRGKSMKAVINEALRRGLGLRGRAAELPPFEVKAHSFGFKPGIDRDRMNQLVDELEAEEFARKYLA